MTRRFTVHEYHRMAEAGILVCSEPSEEGYRTTRRFDGFLKQPLRGLQPVSVLPVLLQREPLDRREIHVRGPSL